MFVTHEAFKFPFAFSKSEAMWSAVELGTWLPWFIGMVEQHAPDEGPVTSGYLLSNDNDVTAFLQHQPAGKMFGLTLVLPPHRSETGDWKLVRAREWACKVAANGELQASEVVLVADDGTQYAGFPMERSADPSPIHSIAVFSIRAPE